MKLRNDKQSEEVLIDRSVKTTTEILCNEGLIEKYDMADEVLKNYLLIDEVNERRRPDLDPKFNEVVIQWYYP